MCIVLFVYRDLFYGQNVTENLHMLILVVFFFLTQNKNGTPFFIYFILF